jgi:pilus assembly protein CpaB
VFAVIFGLVAAGLTWYGFTQMKEGANTKAAAVETAPVVVAKLRIPPRTVMTADMVDIKQVRIEDKHPNAYSAVNDVVGKTTKQSITAGEQVLSTKFFGGREESGLAFIIPEGMRAVSVQVSELSASGGMIVPGDHVDVIAIAHASLEKGTEVSPDGRTVTFGEISKATLALQNVEVLAIGQELRGTEEATTPAVVSAVTGQEAATKEKQPQAAPSARTATLALSPQQIQRLLLFSDLCELHLVLRPAEDEKELDIAPMQLHYGLMK